MLRYKEFILESIKSKRDNAFTFDNFEDKSNGISFPEIEDIDMYLQLIEDDGYKYSIDKYINENNPRHYIDGPEDNFFSFRITILSGKLSRGMPEFIQNMQKIYELFNKKYSNDWNLIAKSHYSGVRIEMKHKEPIKTIDIYKNFQNDINNLLKTNNISFNSKSHIDYNDHYFNINIPDINKFKDNCEKFIKENKYSVSVEYDGFHITFSLIIPILNLSV